MQVSGRQRKKISKQVHVSASQKRMAQDASTGRAKLVSVLEGLPRVLLGPREDFIRILTRPSDKDLREIMQGWLHQDCHKTRLPRKMSPRQTGAHTLLLQ